MNKLKSILAIIAVAILGYFGYQKYFGACCDKPNECKDSVAVVVMDSLSKASSKDSASASADTTKK